MSLTYKIIGFKDDHIALRLSSMGIMIGNEIIIKREAPFGGAKYIYCNGNNFAISKEEFLALDLKSNEQA